MQNVEEYLSSPVAYCGLLNIWLRVEQAGTGRVGDWVRQRERERGGEWKGEIQTDRHLQRDREIFSTVKGR